MTYAIPEEVAACVLAGDHLLDCDDDGYCNACGNQDGPGFDEWVEPDCLPEKCDHADRSAAACSRCCDCMECWMIRTEDALDNPGERV